MVFSCVNVLVFVSLLIAFVIAYFKWTYQYWSRRNVPYLHPKIPFGTSANPFTRKEHVSFHLKRQYDTMKTKGWKYGGLYFIVIPSFMVVDLDLVKNIMTKDFQHFVDRGTYHNEKSDPLSAHLFNIGGQKWRNLRTKLTPTFTSGKMKMMFQTLLECVPNLLQKIELDRSTNTPIDIKETLGCFTTDIIGTCAFGLDCNTFKEENSPFRKYGQKAFEVAPLQIVKLLFAMIWPNAATKLQVTMTPKDVTNFFMKIVKDTVSYREKNNISRNDFMQLLINLKNQPEGEALTIEEIAAQSFVFFLAGFETSSTSMTFTLYELARRPEIQQRVRKEIEVVLKNYDGKVTYDAIQEMKYLDQVINETLRMYPPVSLLPRKCVKDYKVPGEDVIIEKDTGIMIPVLAIHYDEEYYPDPEKFDPERFSDENKQTRHSYAHIPFGEGPRVCIGMRFGLMQTKVGLASLLTHYKFTVDNKTKEPLKMKPNSFILAAEGEIWLNAEIL